MEFDFEDALSSSTHICLLETSESLNVGSVARAMANFGFENLHLCQPENFDPARAKTTACWASSLIEKISHHSNIAEMLSDMEDVVGFTSTIGKDWSGQLTLRQWAQMRREYPTRKTALLFGPEDHGLTREHLYHCSYLIRIPSSSKNPSLNLSHAVAVALYELIRDEGTMESPSGENLPTWNDFSQLDRLLEETLQEVRFDRGGDRSIASDLLKRIFRRTTVNRREMGLLLSLFNRVVTELRYRSRGD